MSPEKLIIQIIAYFLVIKYFIIKYIIIINQLLMKNNQTKTIIRSCHIYTSDIKVHQTYSLSDVNILTFNNLDGLPNDFRIEIHFTEEEI